MLDAVLNDERPKRRGRGLARNLPRREIVHLYLRKGLSTTEIAKRYHVYAGSVRHTLVSAGVAMRTQAESLRLRREREERTT
jgi:hypothetical protein